MRTFAQKENQPQNQGSSGLTQSQIAKHQPDHHEHPILLLQRAIGNQAVQRMLQTKLAISEPGDEQEQDADRISEQVMRMPEPQPGHVRSGDKGQTEVPPIIRETLASSGQPIDSATRAFMEPRFGHDFSDVKVHTDTSAADSAQAIDARAYTVGQDIVFGAGQYAPDNDSGRRLLAHELGHVVQQREANNTSHGVSRTSSPLLQREPTKPRAATGKASIEDLTKQTAGATPGKVTAGSLSRQEWESLFSRHFTEPDKDQDEVESSHARYLYSDIYGWIDAQHFFAHIQFAEELGLQGATDKGLDIEQKQAGVRQFIGPEPDDNSIYSDWLTHNLITPDDFLYYRENLFMAISAGMDVFLSKQEKALIKGFNDQQLAKMILDNAMSAWSYEDLASNQLGVQFFRLHGGYINSGKDAAEVRQRFIEKMTEFFATIKVVNDPAKIKTKAAKLPSKERWTAPKLTEAEARKKYPELFEFGGDTHRLRIVNHSNLAAAEKDKDLIAKAAPSVPGLRVEPMGMQYAVIAGPVSHFEAVILSTLLSKTVPLSFPAIAIEPVATKAAPKP